MPTAPVSPDAIVLSTVHVSDAYMGLYLEHQLIDTVITETTRRGVKAIEAFARAEEFDDSIVQRALGLHSKLDQGEQAVDAKNATPNDQGLPDVASAERTEEAEDATATSLTRDAGKGQETISSTSSPQVLTPLEELKFIPEAYRGWDSESGLDRAADSADASGHAASRQENGAAQDYLERAPSFPKTSWKKKDSVLSRITQNTRDTDGSYRRQLVCLPGSTRQNIKSSMVRGDSYGSGW